MAMAWERCKVLGVGMLISAAGSVSPFQSMLVGVHYSPGPGCLDCSAKALECEGFSWPRFLCAVVAGMYTYLILILVP